MMGNVLITGGAGFIGFHLAQKLVDKGYRVVIADNFTRGSLDTELSEFMEKPNVVVMDLDLRESQNLDSIPSDFEYVVHLAAIIGVRNVVERPYEVLVENTRMLENVIELCRRQKSFSRLLFASTSEVYAGTLRYFDLEVPTPEHSPLTVENLDNPRTSYMLSKILGEAMCRNSDVPFTVFRPHNIYGPRMGMAHVIPEKLMQIWKAHSGGEIEVASPEHTRTFCFIDDATEMLVRIIANDETSGETVNIGADSPEVTITDVVRLCLKVTGKALTLTPGSDTPGSPSRRAPEIATARRLLDFEPVVSLEEGIEKTWEWYRDVFSQAQNTGEINDLRRNRT